MGYSKMDLWRIAQGICLDCKQVPSEPGRRRCKACAKAQADGQRLRTKLPNSGVCSSCGQQPSREKSDRCGDCVRYDQIMLSPSERKRKRKKLSDARHRELKRLNRERRRDGKEI